MFFRPATAEEAQQLGIQQGTIVYDDNVLVDELTDFVAQVKRERDTAARVAAANKAAAFNASQTKGTQQAPVARAKAPAQTPQKSATPDPREEHRKWKRDFLSSPGWPDEDEE